MYVHTYQQTYIRTYIYTCVYTYIGSCVYTYVYVRTYYTTYTYVRTYTYVQCTYIRTYVHTYVHTLKWCMDRHICYVQSLGPAKLRTCLIQISMHLKTFASGLSTVHLHTLACMHVRTYIQYKRTRVAQEYTLRIHICIHQHNFRKTYVHTYIRTHIHTYVFCTCA